MGAPRIGQTLLEAFQSRLAISSQRKGQVASRKTGDEEKVTGSPRLPDGAHWQRRADLYCIPHSQETLQELVENSPESCDEYGVFEV